MTFHELDTVVLTRDVPEHALRRGELGVIVHLHSATVVEVEFSEADGRALRVTTLPTDAMRPAAGHDFGSFSPGA